MRNAVKLTILLLITAAAALQVQARETRCPDYCSGNMQYSRGEYNERTGECGYSAQTRCAYGCASRTECGQEPAQRIPMPQKIPYDYRIPPQRTPPPKIPDKYEKPLPNISIEQNKPEIKVFPDTDEDGLFDFIDNCPNTANKDQKDFNKNGIGDVCDCKDLMQGPNEEGIDCGGICTKCIQCTWCKKGVNPLRIRGEPNKGYIDVVFIAASDLGVGNLAAVATTAIQNTYLNLHNYATEPILENYDDKFNFYIYTSDVAVPGKTCDKLILPKNLDKDLPIWDLASVLSPSAWGFTCALGLPTKLIALHNSTELLMHETGHGVFGLVDEYCGKTYYTQNDPNSNVWSSEANCKNDAGKQTWKAGACTQIQDTGCKKAYWRYDLDTAKTKSYMTCCPDNSKYKFKEAGTRKINYAINNWKATATKGILLNLHINGNTIEYRSSEIIDGHPDLGMQQEHFKAELKSKDGRTINSYGFWDPRITLGDSMEVTDNIDFELRMPWSDELNTIEIQTKDGIRLTVIKLEDTIKRYCKENKEEPECSNQEIAVTDKIADFFKGILERILGR